MKKGRMKKTRGFTLIEMLVSTAIFTIVMVIALGALLAMSESDRKAQTLKAVINNLNFSLDSISRAVRTGTGYHCGSLVGGDCTTPPGGTFFAFTSSDGAGVAYRLENITTDGNAGVVCGQAGNIGCLARSLDNGTTWAAVTAPEVVITNLSFFLIGSAAGAADLMQPKLTILLSGYVQVTASQQTTFNLETSVTQRLYDQ
jgi:prepilin-type N-terminal cleavage/methylation domain-containing protein